MDTIAFPCTMCGRATQAWPAAFASLTLGSSAFRVGGPRGRGTAEDGSRVQGSGAFGAPCASLITRRGSLWQPMVGWACGRAGAGGCGGVRAGAGADEV